VDYTSPASPIAIAATAGEAVVLVTATPDNVIEGTETISMLVQPGAGYVVGLRQVPPLAIKDRPFDEWRFQYFTAAERDDLAIISANADPDAAAYRTFSNTLRARSTRFEGCTALHAGIVASRLTLDYFQPRNATDLLYTAEVALPSPAHG
jgi:hypothetical protein